MRRLLTTIAGMAVMVLVAAAPAMAATTLGSSATALDSSCGTGTAAWETDGAFVVPTGGGIITSMATHSPSTAGTMALKVVRGTTIIGTSPSFSVVAGENRQAVHIPVTGGEFLGLWVEDAACASSTSSGSVVGGSAASDPPVGTAIPPTGSTTATLAVEATLEADADGDGFADDTEDSCPSDPAIHTGSCQVDVGLTQAVVPAKIGVGDIAVATVTVKNGSTGTAAGLAVGATVTPGLQIVSSFPSAGCAFTPALSCPLGALAGGASTVAALVVKGVSAGRQTVTSGSSTSSTDPNAANNTASSTVTVERRVALVCTVPKLTGLTKGFAKTLLQAVHCKLGKTTKKKSAKGNVGTVIKQSKKPKTVLKAGSKVNVTLKK